MLEFFIDHAVRRLGSSLTQNSVLLGRKNLPPFFGGFADRFGFLFHCLFFVVGFSLKPIQKVDEKIGWKAEKSHKKE